MADLECQILWVTIGDLAISFATPGTARQADLDRFLHEVTERNIKRYLATVVGSAQLTASQRKQVSDLYQRLGLQVAVLADEMLTRGVVTALGWLGVNIKAFAWKDIRAALQYLQVSKLVEGQAIEAVTRMRKESGIGGQFPLG